jgi:hypothetical protein
MEKIKTAKTKKNNTRKQEKGPTGKRRNGTPQGG